jgi:hypothetical protein
MRLPEAMAGLRLRALFLPRVAFGGPGHPRSRSELLRVPKTTGG